MFEEDKISDRQFVDNPYVDPVDFYCMEDEDVKKQNGGWRIHRKFNSARILYDDEVIGFTEGKYYCGSIVSTRLNRVTKAETGEKIYYLNIKAVLQVWVGAKNKVSGKIEVNILHKLVISSSSIKVV